MTSTILVTGAAGFVGRHVAREASRAGHEVRGMGHGTWAPDEWRDWGLSDWVSCDITLDALTADAGGPDLIVHCAGSGAVGFSLSHPAQDFARTVLTTRDVLEYVRLHSPRTRVVLPSSAGVYGDSSELPNRVGAPLKPASPYGVHKQIAEQLCISYGRHFAVPAAIVRLFSVYGIGLRKQLLWDACSRLSRGPASFGGTGLETRDWLHIEDAAKLLLIAGRSASSSCPVVNGGSGRSVPIRDIVESIARAFGNAGNARFSGASRPGDPIHLVADLQEALELGWRPERKLDVELPRYVDWFNSVSP